MSVLSRLPPLMKRAAPKPSSDWSSPEWLLDARAPVLGGCEPCAGRGRFVWHANAHITLECEHCKGTGR